MPTTLYIMLYIKCFIVYIKYGKVVDCYNYGDRFKNCVNLFRQELYY